MSLARALADVDAVLALGATKHGDLEAGRAVDPAHHLAKARSHLERAPGVDAESGLPHAAHAAARLLLALAASDPVSARDTLCYVLSDDAHP